MALDFGDDAAIKIQRDVRETNLNELPEQNIDYSDALGHDHAGTGNRGKPVVALGQQVQNADFNSNKLINLANGSSAQDSAAYGQIAIKSGTHYYSISAADFVPQDNSNLDWTRGSSDEATIENGTTGTVDFFAPVHLPDGAIVTSVAAKGPENDGSWTMYRNPFTSSGASMASGDLNDTDITISNATINNALYKYLIFIQIPPELSFTGFVITYTL